MTTEQHLAEDWKLFQRVEEGTLDYAWRLWDVHAPAVVLGMFGNVNTDVAVAHCERDGIPVLRRFSGGGAVVIAAGCLNFTILLSLARHPELLDIARSFHVVLRPVAAATGLAGVVIEGETDLAVGGRKVSGNAQRRGRRALIHHGTLLLGDFDVTLAAKYLQEPTRRPAYRGSRQHSDFMGTLPLERRVLEERLSAAFADGRAFGRLA